MTSTAEEEGAQEHLRVLNDALAREAHDEVASLLAGLHPAEIALLIESVPSGDRNEVWAALEAELQAQVLAEVEDEVRASRMSDLTPEALAELAQEVDSDDAADMLQDLPEPVVEEVLGAMDAQNRARLESILHYDEDTAGGLMDLDVLTLRADVNVGVVHRYLRLRGEIPEKTNRLFVVDRDGCYLGMVRLADLLTHDPDRLVRELMSRELEGVGVNTPTHEVARLFEQRNLISAPVVDDVGKLLGRITIDDVVDVIREEGEHSFMSMAGLAEHDDIFAPVFTTTRRRTVWLGINLATALLASWVIGLFQATLEQMVALAVLMPVVASMGGIAGSQTLTVVIRGMALGQVGSSNAASLLSRELVVGILNSVFWAVVLAFIAAAWFGNNGLGVVVAVALVFNLAIAALAGAVIPLLLKQAQIDPALAGGVILTTITDVVGFMTFLGLGAIFLV